MKNVFVVVVIFLQLVACKPLTERQATLTANGMTTATFLNATTTVMETPALTSTLTATQTRTPTRTSTTTRTPTRTSIPSTTPNLAATVVAIQQPRLYASYPSPDGMWRADIIIYDCVMTSGPNQAGTSENAYEQLILVNLATGKERLADEQLQSCGGLGGFGFGGLFWSPNSRFFYYTEAREGAPDGSGYWEPPILRVEATNLDKRYLGIGHRSPDGRKIAAWQWPQHESVGPSPDLVVWDIDNEEIARFSLYYPVAQIGPIIWSPDSQRLVYLQNEFSEPVSGNSSLVLVDYLELKQALLLESEHPTFGSVSWVVSYELILVDENWKEWRFDLLTHELAQIP
ncbi:MAG: hypothetical protein WAM09_08040 [Anaerolineales bacterium]|jgi:hypothetical protein